MFRIIRSVIEINFAWTRGITTWFRHDGIDDGNTEVGDGERHFQCLGGEEDEENKIEWRGGGGR